MKKDIEATPCIVWQYCQTTVQRITKQRSGYAGNTRKKFFSSVNWGSSGAVILPMVSTALSMVENTI
jgi:hypothetical protein